MEAGAVPAAGPDDVMDTPPVTDDPTVTQETRDDDENTSPDMDIKEALIKSEQESTTEDPDTEDKVHFDSTGQTTINAAGQITTVEHEGEGIAVGVAGCTGTMPKTSQPDFSTEKTRMEPESQSDGHVDSINSANKPLKEDGQEELNSTTHKASQTDGPAEMITATFGPSECSVSLLSEMNQKVQSLNIVVFGNISTVSFGDENILLGQQQVPLEPPHLPRARTVSGRIISVINILDLHEGELYLDPVDHAIDQLFTENNIHSFIFALKLGQLTDDDMAGLEWLQRKFGENVLSFVIILFTYEREEACDTIIDDLKKNSVLEELLKKCGDRYHTCSKSMNNQSEMRTLLEKIDHLVSENKQHCYTADQTSLKTREKQRVRSQITARAAVQIQEDDIDSLSISQDPNIQRKVIYFMYKHRLLNI